MVRSSLIHNNASRPRRSNNSTTNNQEYLNNDCHRIYSCIHCRAHLANHDELISTAFQGTHGRAYLFNSVVNVGCGPAEQRLLMTGLHDVADIYCDNCKTTLGWKYKQAFEASQKYKEGKYIIELAHMLKENSWDLTSYNYKDIMEDETTRQERLLRDRRRCPNYNPWPVMQQSCDDQQTPVTTTTPTTTITTTAKESSTLNNKNLSDSETASAISRDNRRTLSADTPTNSAATYSNLQINSKSEDISNQIIDKKIIVDADAPVVSREATIDISENCDTAVCDLGGIPIPVDLLELNDNLTERNQFISFRVPTHFSEKILDADQKKHRNNNEPLANLEPQDGRDSDLASQTTTTTPIAHTATIALEIKQTRTKNNNTTQRDVSDLDAMNNLCDLHPTPSSSSTSASSCSSSSSSSSSSSENSILSSSVSSTSSSASSTSSSLMQSPAYLPNTSAVSFQLSLAQLRQPC